MDIRVDLPPNAPPIRPSHSGRGERTASARERFTLAPEAQRDVELHEPAEPRRSVDSRKLQVRHAEERPEGASRSTQDDRGASFETPAAQAPQDDDVGSSGLASLDEEVGSFKDASRKDDEATQDSADLEQSVEIGDAAPPPLPIFVTAQPSVPPAGSERAGGPTPPDGIAAQAGKAQPRSVPGLPGMAAGAGDTADEAETTASTTPPDGEAVAGGTLGQPAEHMPAKMAAALAEGIPSPAQGSNPAVSDPSLTILPPAPAAGGAANGIHGAPAPADAAPRHVVEGVPVSAVPVEIGLKSLQGINRFDIRLDPEDLGRIDVRLDISDEGRVRAHIIVEQPAALATLQRETSMLERALEQAGFRTGGDGISLGLRGEGDGRAGQGDARTSQPSGEASRASAADEPPPPPTWNLRWSRASGVDRRV